MPCFHPIRSWQCPDFPGHPVFSLTSPGSNWLYKPVACRHCSGCIEDYSRSWRVRCFHQARMSGFDNCFLTLTYDAAHLPARGQLVRKHVQDFLKRLRYAFPGRDIRYYGCGEYGDRYSRPHFHINVFGARFDDMKLHSKSKAGEDVFTSEKLSKLWTFGFATVQEFSAATASYCANYVSKVVHGPKADDHYWRVDELGAYQLMPQFSFMSLKPAVGLSFLDRYFSDIYPHDFCVIDGHKLKVPKAYDRVAKSLYPSMFNRVQVKREERGDATAWDLTDERLAVRAQVHAARISQRKRVIE